MEKKVEGWEAKVVDLRVRGEAERVEWVEGSLAKATEKVAKAEDGIEALERSVERLETRVGDLRRKAEGGGQDGGEGG